MHRLFLFPWLLLALTASFPLTASDLGKGGLLYRTHCASCHGANGQSLMAGVPDFNRPGALLQSDSSLLTRIQSGNRACPGYLGVLSEQEIFDVIAFIRSLGLQ